MENTIFIFLHPNFQKNRLFEILFISLERLKKWLSIVVYIDYYTCQNNKIDVNATYFSMGSQPQLYTT